MDMGQKLPAEITMSFEDPADLVRVLSAERVRVMDAVRRKPELAARLKRDRKSVKRDVTLLQLFGLDVLLHIVIAVDNLGHALAEVRKVLDVFVDAVVVHVIRGWLEHFLIER